MQAGKTHSQGTVLTVPLNEPHPPVGSVALDAPPTTDAVTIIRTALKIFVTLWHSRRVSAPILLPIYINLRRFFAALRMTSFLCAAIISAADGIFTLRSAEGGAPYSRWFFCVSSGMPYVVDSRSFVNVGDGQDRSLRTINYRCINYTHPNNSQFSIFNSTGLILCTQTKITTDCCEIGRKVL